MKVPLDSYVNLPALTRRLACLEPATQLGYLGVPKVVAADGPLFRVAEGEAGVVLRRELLQLLGTWFDTCLREGGLPDAFREAEDVVLGTCLWMHGVELHSWLDPMDESIFSPRDGVTVHPSSAVALASRPFARLSDTHGEKTGTSTMQCVMLVSGLSAEEIRETHATVGKSYRWFKNIACIPGGFMFPELTSAASRVDGKDQKEPVFSPDVRTALQKCFLSSALERLQASAPAAALATARAGASGTSVGPRLEISSADELLQEWKSPRPVRTPATETLHRGHFLCIFVLATAATARHATDAAAVLQTWAADAAGQGEEGTDRGVKVLVVSRDIDGPEDGVLRLPADVDLGFLYNSVRAFYLWSYLSKHHVNECKWFAKVDGDTFVNTDALKERLARYFNPAKLHYLGSMKDTFLGSGRKLRFAVNAAILSQELMRQAGPWFEVCIDDLVKRKLGRGAEDMDLAYCLDFHGKVLAERVGASQEYWSRGMTKASGAGSMLPAQTGACTLLQHPVHSEDMHKMHSELSGLLAARKPSPTGWHCDWPPDLVHDKAKHQKYMREQYANGRTDCWIGKWNWQTCCDTRMWGPEGNDLCWDEEHRFDRCCDDATADLNATLQGSTELPLAAAGAGRRPPPVPWSGDGGATADVAASPAAVAAAPPPRRRLTSLSGEADGQGNPKCWADGDFTFEMCCLRRLDDCWVWPYSWGFCCQAPLPARSPLQVGGLLGDLVASAPAGSPFVGKPRSARCATALAAGTLSEEQASTLLACTNSLDEIGVLFELKTIGTGDKARGWHDYLGAYERLLLHIPLTASVVEAGVRGGSSLAMWSEYFPFGQIVGIDKDIGTFMTSGRAMLAQVGAFTHDNVRVVQGNATDISIVPILEEFGVEQASADVIVDDANHWAKDQIARFEVLFPWMLKPGGIYIVEDVHIQAPFAHDGIAVRAYFANLSASSYITDQEILVGAHHIESLRRDSDDWRHQVESVTLMRDMVAITKAP